MRRLTILLLLLTALCAPVFGADCSALTLSTLSTLSSHPVPYETWVKDLHITDSHSPNLPEVIAAWNAHFLLTPLVCTFSEVNGQKVVDRTIDPDAGIPYLWVGTIPDSLIAQTGGDDNCHVAIALVRKEGILLVHTLNQSPVLKQRFYTEHLTWPAFFARTLVVLEVVPSIPGMTIQWGSLPVEVLK